VADSLFDDAELFTGDPLDPDFNQVCPPSVVISLTPAEREERVKKLVEQAHLIVDKNATITVGIYGYLPGYGNWVKCDSIALAATNVAEAVAVRSVASFTRVQSTVEAIGASGAANFFWAFTGE
jgi:hypothetical protein